MAKDIAFDASFISPSRPAGNGLTKRLAESTVAWFKRRNESEVERLVSESGGVMTDALEREISRRATHSHGL